MIAIRVNFTKNPNRLKNYSQKYNIYFAISIIDCIIDFLKLLVMSDKDKVIIFDTTMRDGEQSPGASMSIEEKIQIARIFDELGIDIIEAGFPIASPGDFEAVTAISKILKNSIPCGLSRASKKDIDACHEALKAAPRFRIHTFISTSPLHMKFKLNKSPEQVVDAIKESVTYARNLNR